MSLLHHLLPKKPLDISELHAFVSTLDHAVYEDRGEGVFYYWIDGRSTRGFDITIDGGVIEVRNTILSNKPDYMLTNAIVAKIVSLTDALVLDENDEPMAALPLFDDQRISDAEINDCQLIQTLAAAEEDIAIFGPKRKVHFGRRLHERFQSYSGKALCEAMFGVITTVNYQIPDFEDGNILQVGDTDDDRKTMKLLTNNVNCIIGKYDYILLSTPAEPVMITNAVLNELLPADWTLVDEFTVVAPVIPEEAWAALLNRARAYDLFDAFRS